MFITSVRDDTSATTRSHCRHVNHLKEEIEILHPIWTIALQVASFNMLPDSSYFFFNHPQRRKKWPRAWRTTPPSVPEGWRSSPCPTASSCPLSPSPSCPSSGRSGPAPPAEWSQNPKHSLNYHIQSILVLHKVSWKSPKNWLNMILFLFLLVLQIWTETSNLFALGFIYFMGFYKSAFRIHCPPTS